jgi:hypothetical protein
MRSAFKWTSWCLSVVFPMTLFASDAESVAMLSGKGTVQINGAITQTSSTVFTGDRVATAKDSSVTLTSAGRNIVLPEKSSITYGGKQVRLEYGRVLINAQPGTEAQLGNLTISPSQAGSQFEMRSSDRPARPKWRKRRERGLRREWTETCVGYWPPWLGVCSDRSRNDRWSYYWARGIRSYFWWEQQ